MNVREIGEQGLLQRLQSFCPPEMIGDDAAILTLPPGRSLVVTSDVLVDRVHFSDQTTAPEDVGWRAAAANLSDLAAMGANPIGITVALGLPGDLPLEWVEHLYRGLTQCLTTYGTVIVGGDVVRSSVTTIAITAFGEVDPTQAIQRSKAQPGQAIVATGYHGSSRAGLELLLHSAQSAPLSAADQVYLLRAHQQPRPRLDVLPILRECFADASLSFSTSTIGGMDSSDGLADAVVQICRASGVGAQLERCQIPIAPPVEQWVGLQTAIEWALYGGEDFELVLCLPPEVAHRLVQKLGQGSAIVGTITATLDVWLVDSDNPLSRQQLTLEQGFQHFK